MAHLHRVSAQGNLRLSKVVPTPGLEPGSGRYTEMLALVQNLGEEALRSLNGESKRCVLRLLNVLARCR